MKQETIKDKLDIVYQSLSYIKSEENILSFYFPKDSYAADDFTKTPYYYRLVEIFQRITLSTAAELACQSFESLDLLEIGAAEGITTCCFAQVAKKYNRKLYVIDPYNGQECGTLPVYEKFKENTSKYNNIIHLRQDSRDKNLHDILGKEKFCFSYVDGLHSQDAPLNDINLSLDLLVKGGIICVDDTEDFNSLVGRILKQKIKDNYIEPFEYKQEHSPLLKEKSWHLGFKL